MPTLIERWIVAAGDIPTPTDPNVLSTGFIAADKLAARDSTGALHVFSTGQSVTSIAGPTVDMDIGIEDPEVYIFEGPLAANRTITLLAEDAYQGARKAFNRSDGADQAYSITFEDDAGTFLYVSPISTAEYIEFIFITGAGWRVLFRASV